MSQECRDLVPKNAFDKHTHHELDSSQTAEIIHRSELLLVQR